MVETSDMVETSAAPLIAALQDLLGDDAVITDEAERQFFATDVFSSSELPAAAIRPASKKALADAVACSTAAGYCVVPRGGGLSYTDGYLSGRARAVLVDTQALNRIVEINAEDMYVTVECGVTWKQLYEALREKGLRTPFFGTGSGMHATVGGALSQNALNYGSTMYGTAADSVLGLEVALADGSLMRTGSAATPHQPSPFLRSYGPDLTGLFLADCGALGIKVEATLRLIPSPGATQFASFDLATHVAFANALAGISRRAVAAECFGYDPFFITQRLKVRHLSGDLKRLAGVARAGTSVLGGLADAIKVAAAGRSYLEGTSYALHVVVDGRDKADAASAMAVVKSAARDCGAEEIENTLPQVVRGTPFGPPNLMLGAGGERWIPMHALLPHSRLVAAMEALDGYFDGIRDIVEAHEIEWGYIVLGCGTSACLIEPSLFWKDAIEDFHLRYLEPSFLRKLPRHAPNPAGRAAVAQIRCDLADLFMRMGAAHFQIGRFYPYRDSRHEETFGLLQAVKQHVDPRGLMNPGVLGLG